MTVASDMILGDAEVGLAAGAESMSQVREKGGTRGEKGGEGREEKETGRRREGKRGKRG